MEKIMAEENAIAPKEAITNLVKSLKTPFIWFSIGVAATLIYQARQKSRRQIG
jgi:hypothetical protein